MLKSDVYKFGDFSIKITQHPAVKGLRLKAKLIRIFGPALATLIGGLDEESKSSLVAGKKDTSILDNDFDLSVLGDSIESLFSKLNEDGFIELVFEILEFATVNDQGLSEDVFNATFAGAYEHLYKSIGVALKLNYGSFFVKGGIGKLMSLKTPSQPVSPST